MYPACAEKPAKPAAIWVSNTFVNVVLPGAAQDRDVLAPGVHDDLDRRVGQHRGKRRRDRRARLERVEHDDLVADADLHEAEQRPVAALRHELGVDARAGPPRGHAAASRSSWDTAGRRYLISTGVPIGTRRNRSITSGTRHADAAVRRARADRPGLPVPWMPTPPSTPIQRALSGLSAAPPATGWPAISPAHGRVRRRPGRVDLLASGGRTGRSGSGRRAWPTATP